ncbi:MAG: hypothetical protein QN183_05295 [Armatimonadota bacterium]|nr:hypothetical protein [Armatimonadota bacterium]MDR7535764.1 hypothetical protein [Armatimonadota bacterium]
MRYAVSAAVREVRAGLGLAALLRQPPAPMAGPEEEMRARVARRAENFLWSVEHLIFAYPDSPYRPLLEVAGYDLPRVRHLVMTLGLDAALDRLWQDGVYVRIQEFKGREPVTRHGRTFRFHERAFANPAAPGVLRGRSSGSRSGGTQTEVSTDDLIYHARLLSWLLDEYGLRERDVVVWLTPGAGLERIVRFSLAGHRPLQWFSPVGFIGRATPLMLAVARAAGSGYLPRLRVVPPERVLEVARYIARVNTRRGLLVAAFVNSALRLVLTAEEAGVALGDVAFLLLGEPVTPVKRRQIEARGFTVVPRFGFFELGEPAWACPSPRESDDLHVLTDMVVLRQYPRVVDRDGTTVPAYLFTTLLPHARHVMLNLETGDYGGLEERSCGCFLERAGLRLHMHTIRSFEKLTAEGITFLGPGIIDLLEEVLPRTFGGDSRHYQLVEGEDARGFTKLYLLASPCLGPLDEAALRRTLLEELGERHLHPAYGRSAATVWRQADTVRVLRRDPLPTAAGKVLHLHRVSGAVIEAGGG